MMQVRLMVEPFSMYLSCGPMMTVLGWMTPRYMRCSRCGVVLTWWQHWVRLFVSPLELETKVHTKVRNPGEGPY